LALRYTDDVPRYQGRAIDDLGLYLILTADVPMHFDLARKLSLLFDLHCVLPSAVKREYHRDDRDASKTVREQIVLFNDPDNNAENLKPP